jgi:hypothetical protein
MVSCSCLYAADEDFFFYFLVYIFIRTDATDPLTYTVTAFEFFVLQTPEDGHQ